MLEQVPECLKNIITIIVNINSYYINSFKNNKKEQLIQSSFNVVLIVVDDPFDTNFKMMTKNDMIVIKILK